MDIEGQTVKQEVVEKLIISPEQSLIYAGKICPYCKGETEFVNSSAVYDKSYGMIYLCRPCDAYVGVHSGTSNAKGRLANKELRYWKKEAHAHFDPIWQAKLNKGEAKYIVRNRCYKWLSEEMKLHRELTHIGFMDIDQCKRLIDICKNVIIPEESGKEEKKAKLPDTNQNKENSSRSCPGLHYSYAEFDKEWLPTFKKRLGKNAWFDSKKYCYTFVVMNDQKKPFTVDFYPRADKVFLREENVWIKWGMEWLVKNVLGKAGSKS